MPSRRANVSLLTSVTHPRHHSNLPGSLLALPFLGRLLPATALCQCRPTLRCERDPHLGSSCHRQFTPMDAPNTPLPPKNSKLVGSGLSNALRITPSNSPVLKPPARPSRPPFYQTTLSLQTVIGTTTANPNGLSYHADTRAFALCAGSAAILAELDDDLNVSQRFFRARPGATGLYSVPSFYNPPTAPNTPNPKQRSSVAVRRISVATGFHSTSPTVERGEVGSSRTWSSRERIKAATAVSLSLNGKFLAVGEVCCLSRLSFVLMLLRAVIAHASLFSPQPKTLTLTHLFLS